MALLCLSNCLENLLPDTCLLACEVTEVEDACPAHFTVLVDLNLVNEGGYYRENSLHANISGHFADCEGSSHAIPS